MRPPEVSCPKAMAVHLDADKVGLFSSYQASEQQPQTHSDHATNPYSQQCLEDGFNLNPTLRPTKLSRRPRTLALDLSESTGFAKSSHRHQELPGSCPPSRHLFTPSASNVGRPSHDHRMQPLQEDGDDEEAMESLYAYMCRMEKEILGARRLIAGDGLSNVISPNGRYHE